MAYNNKSKMDIELAFHADTQAAKKQLQELQTVLQNVAKMPGSGESFFNDESIKNNLIESCNQDAYSLYG